MLKVRKPTGPIANVKKQKQKNFEMVKEVEDAIISVCENLRQGNVNPELYAQTIVALAALVLARAVLR